MAAELARRGLLDHRRALAGWCIGVIGYAALLASIFPSFKGSGDLQKIVQRYPEALKQLFGIGSGSIGTGAGFLDAELFSLMLPLLLLVLAIGSGARTFAGEEEAGRLELVISYPLRRRDAVLAKGAALAAEWLVGESPLQNGVDWWGILVVLGAAAAALVAGALLVERRDLETP
jgi:beta-exotoxin I transport system permease protein